MQSIMYLGLPYYCTIRKKYINIFLPIKNGLRKNAKYLKHNSREKK
jgi:hypothetical protein